MGDGDRIAETLRTEKIQLALCMSAQNLHIDTENNMKGSVLTLSTMAVSDLVSQSQSAPCYEDQKSAG